MHKNIIETS